MKTITKEAISGLNDIVMELPAFRDLQSRDNIKEVLDIFMDEVYIKGTQDLFDAFDFKMSPKMQEVQFLNFGIQPKYSRNIKGYLKKDISYKLEVLFQNKGSKVIFRIFADLFENIFRNMNFYNIVVNKIPNGSSFRFEYALEPIYITDPDHIIKYPTIEIKEVRKYLMELENFKDYTMWPMTTNLVYIQMSMGTELINNMDVFLDGIRSYGTTYLQGEPGSPKLLEYKNRHGYIEKIRASDVELITSYFAIEIIKQTNPDAEFKFKKPLTGFGSNLPYDPTLKNPVDSSDPLFHDYELWTQDRISFMENMQELIEDYATADYADMNPKTANKGITMEHIKRRWQLFLRLKAPNETCYINYDGLYKIIGDKYPLMQEDFLYNLDLAKDEDSNEPLFDFYLYLYSIFLNGVYAFPESPALGLNQDWVIDYVDVLFGNLFLEADFLTNYFNPVMDLFIRYFFPIEMEYINDMLERVLIRDKFNSVGTDAGRKSFVVKANHYSLVNAPLLHIDYRNFWFTVRIEDEYRIRPNFFMWRAENTDEYDIKDHVIPRPIIYPTEKLKLEDNMTTAIIRGANIVGLPRRASVSIRGCLNDVITKEYVLKTFKKAFKSKKIDSVKNVNHTKTTIKEKEKNEQNTTKKNISHR